MILYTAELGLAPEHLDAFTAWYSCRHAPDLYQAGFQACTSFQGSGNGMSVLNLYHLPSWDLFEEPAYRAVGPNDPYGAPIVALARAKANTPYDILHSWPGNRKAAIEGAWLSAIRFEAGAGTEQAIANHLANVGSARLRELGAIHVHLVRRGRPHPAAASDQPSGAIFVEWGGRPPADDPVLPMLASAQVGLVSRTSVFVGQRVYPWPNGNEAN